jgi:beta-lactam-binding protein with PASTA domain
MSFHYLLEDGLGSLLLENGGFLQLESAPSNMPNVVGLELPAAQLALQSAGILVLASIGYFGTWPIAVKWLKSNQPPGTVLAQSPVAGNFVEINGNVVLTVAEYPIAVAWP